VELAASSAGLDHLGTTSQAAFLAGLGVGELLVGLQSGPSASLEGYLDARSALIRMLDPGVTGGFAVMAFGRGLPALPPLAGLAYRPPVRREAGPATLEPSGEVDPGPRQPGR
jgi:SAM-dependent MidA family methyltransferase